MTMAATAVNKRRGGKDMSNNARIMPRTTRIPPPSGLLVDLHVYLVPREKWLLARRLPRHLIVEDTVSLGFVRVIPHLSLHNLRRELTSQLGPDLLPRDYIYIRCVGRNFAQVKTRQERELKVKNFVPPYASDPEIFILELLPFDDLSGVGVVPGVPPGLPPIEPDSPPLDPLDLHPRCKHGRARKREKLLSELSEVVQARQAAELHRADLVEKANDLYARVRERRDKLSHNHERWRLKYVEESSNTRPLEDVCTTLRAELNTLHRRLLAHLEGRDLPLRVRDGPSKKANFKITAARLQHEIKDLQQKVKTAKLRLDSENKLKEQAQREVRDLRGELSQKKAVYSLARQHQLSNSIGWHRETAPPPPLNIF